jgi:hypothetical protein
MNRGRASRWDSDDEPYEEDDDRYDDSQGYSDDEDEDEEYEEFLDREFGSKAKSSRLTRLQFWTAIVLLLSFTLPLLTYFVWAISQ